MGVGSVAAVAATIPSPKSTGVSTVSRVYLQVRYSATPVCSETVPRSDRRFARRYDFCQLIVAHASQMIEYIWGCVLLAMRAARPPMMLPGVY
jgi:hypothetical protein